MKINTKQIEKGMTIKYRGHFQPSDVNYLSVTCGTIKKSSPIVVVKEVEGLTQKFKHTKEIIIKTECGLRLNFSTRQSVILIK